MNNRKMKPAAEKAYQYFLDTPGAKVSSVAKRFKLSVPYVYKLREKARGPSEGTLTIEEWAGETADALVTQNKAMTETLDSRATAYGTFADNARLAQALKRAMAEHAQDMGKTFADDQWEALEMIASKMSRIVNGNPDGIDNWHDIAGYATLVADRLRGVSR
jgi:hypothetical protein